MSLPLAHPEDAASPPHKPTHSGLKHLADGLTALRLVGTPAIPLLGLARGPSVVSGAAGWLLLGLWLTDTFDGLLARRSGHAGEGIFGRHEGWVDLALALASFTLLAVTGFVPPWLYGVAVPTVVVLCLVEFVVFQGLAIFLLTGLYFVVACLQDATYLYGILAFFALHAVFSQKRFAFLVSEFLGRFRSR